jgi:SAM-dependent methyltransferase
MTSDTPLKQQAAVANLVTVVVRGSRERTEDCCCRIAREQVPPENVVLVRERPFATALRRGMEIAVVCGRPWTVFLDADTLLVPGAIAGLLDFAERLDGNVFRVYGRIVDKLMGGPRPANPSISRTSLLAKALTYIPSDGLSLRPETFVLRRMQEEGWRSLGAEMVTAIHDHEQYYRDVYRKAVVHVKKHAKWVFHFDALWRRLAHDDPDYLVARWGLKAGLEFQGPIQLDSRQFAEEIASRLEREGLVEKPPLPPSAWSGPSVARWVDAFTPPPEYEAIAAELLGSSCSTTCVQSAAAREEAARTPLDADGQRCAARRLEPGGTDPEKVPWDFPRWSVIRHLQDIGLTRAAKYARGLSLDLGGHKLRQRGFFRLEQVPGVRRVCLNLDASHEPDLVADAHAIPFADATFETVWAVAILLYCHSPARVFSEAARVLKPGGHFVVYEPLTLVAEREGDWHRLTPAGMRRLGELAGLETAEVRSCGGMLGVILHAVNDQFYYRAGRGYRGRWVTRLLAPLLPALLRLDDRRCRKDTDYARFATGWIYAGRKKAA